MSDLNALKDAVVEMQEGEALSLTQQFLDEGVDPALLFGAFQKALAEIGDRFEREIYFVPNRNSKACWKSCSPWSMNSRPMGQSYSSMWVV
jgi:methanogenic corrinoid protein MtbC1